MNIVSQLLSMMCIESNIITTYVEECRKNVSNFKLFISVFLYFCILQPAPTIRLNPAFEKYSLPCCIIHCFYYIVLSFVTSWSCTCYSVFFLFFLILKQKILMYVFCFKLLLFPAACIFYNVVYSSVVVCYFAKKLLSSFRVDGFTCNVSNHRWV